MTATVDFDVPDLAGDIERLDSKDIDTLPFGVIRLDDSGTILLLSDTERRAAGFDKAPVGQNLFELSRCFGSDEFRGRIARAQEEGPVDLEIAWPGDRLDPTRELRIRVQSARPDGLWLFIERDVTPAKRAARA